MSSHASQCKHEEPSCTLIRKQLVAFQTNRFLHTTSNFSQKVEREKEKLPSLLLLEMFISMLAIRKTQANYRQLLAY